MIPAPMRGDKPASYDSCLAMMPGVASGQGGACDGVTKDFSRAKARNQVHTFFSLSFWTIWFHFSDRCRYHPMELAPLVILSASFDREIKWKDGGKTVETKRGWNKTTFHFLSGRYYYSRTELA